MAISFYKKKIIYREDHQPYLIRYTLFTCPWFSIKIHNILLSDYACLHCHPWPFITILLKGAYIEHAEIKTVKTKSYFYMGIPTTGTVITTSRKQQLCRAGHILFRPATYKHSLHIEKPVWSFVITFKKIREWGFYPPEGFTPWFKYFDNGRCE